MINEGGRKGGEEQASNAPTRQKVMLNVYEAQPQVFP
jgi:hypothetical protein